MMMMMLCAVFQNIAGKISISYSLRKIKKKNIARYVLKHST